MDASQRLEQSLNQHPRPTSILSPQRLRAVPAGSSPASVLSPSATSANNNSPTTNTATTNTNASQNLVISSNDDFHWCAEMDYQFGQWSTHSQRGLFENSASQISFTSNSDSSVSAGRYHKNFDIHLAQIDIETFTSEDIERISHNSFSRPMEDSADTLRIVESLRSLNVANGEPSKQHPQQQQQQLLQPPSDDCEALSVDSLDLSLDNEINAQLIQKCSERDKTRYKIAMIDTSMHSQMQNSAISTHSDIDCVLNNHHPHQHHHHNNNNHHNLHHPQHYQQQQNRVANGPAANLQLNLSRRAKSDHRCSNPFIASLQQQQQQCDNSSSSKNSSVETLQSPGSLVQMFIQNKIGSNENSTVLDGCYPVSNGNYLNESLSKCDMNGFGSNYRNNNNSSAFYGRQHSQGSGDPLGGSGYLAEDPLEQSVASNSLNTVDSNELPLHVLDLSKKLRSMNLNKQTRFGSTSASSNTSYTSTTTSSSAATFDRRKTSGGGQTVSGCSTNPFLQTGGGGGDKRTRTTSTQFPEMFQDKEVQASFEEEESREAPVLVYYPNYSLPDLSFLQDIFRQDSHSRQPIYLSPVKHEPPKMAADGSCSTAGTSTGGAASGGEVRRRVATGSSSATSQRKCRPKSYTDYETLLSQDLCEIKDWDSLNLLLPDDFREFIEKNNLLRTPSNSSTTFTSGQQQPQQFGQPGTSCAYPIRTTIPNSRAPHSVKMRSHARREQPSTKRYSLQEAHYDSSSNQQYYYQNNPHLRYYQPAEMDGQYQQHHHHHDLANQLNMTRSQTMPNCQAGGFQAVAPSMIGGGVGGPYCPPPPPPSSANYYQHFQQQHQQVGNACCGHPCCHSGCHSPSFHSSQNSPSSKPPNFNWEMLSSSRFQKLLSFLSKLDECAPDHSDHSTSTTKADTQQAKGASHNNSITTTTNEQKSSAQKRANRTSSGGTVDREQSAAAVPSNRTTRPSSMRAPSRLEHKSKTVSTGTTTATAAAASAAAAAAPVTNRQQSVASGMGTNLQSKATSPMSTNRQVASRRPGHAATETKTKIILKRPTTLKNHGGGGGGHSGIPVPKRTSSRSMIPTPLSVGSGGGGGAVRHTAGKETTRTKERLKSGANSQF